MSEQETSDPVIGDGVVTLPPAEQEEEKMPADLPDNFANQLMAESGTNMQADNRRGRDAATGANNILYYVGVRNHDEVGVMEGRAVSGVNATPIAGPANAQQ